MKAIDFIEITDESGYVCAVRLTNILSILPSTAAVDINKDITLVQVKKNIFGFSNPIVVPINYLELKAKLEELGVKFIL